MYTLWIKQKSLEEEMKEQINRISPENEVLEAKPDTESRRRDLLHHIQERRKRKCAPPKRVIANLGLGRGVDLDTPNPPTSSEVSSFGHNGKHASVVTPDSPFNVSLSIIPGLTPWTPISGHSYINLQSYQFTGVLDNQLDDPDRDDPMWVSDYVQDMYAYFRVKEVEFLVNANYVYQHKYFGLGERHELVDWLISVHWKLGLMPEVLYLSVNILDRYMEMNVDGKKTTTDLVGLACLRIAAKQEDFLPPLRVFEDICDREFKGSDIVKMETKVLTALRFKIFAPTPFVFLARYLRAAHANKSLLRKSFLILDATLPNPSSLRFLPSQLAAASIYLARESTGLNPWSPTLLRESLYCEEAIAPVAEEIYLEQARRTPQAVKNKYHRHEECVIFERDTI